MRYARWETINYLLIENIDTDYIKIVPIETIRDSIEGTYNYDEEIYYEMNPLIINLK